MAHAQGHACKTCFLISPTAIWLQQYGRIKSSGFVVCDIQYLGVACSWDSWDRLQAQLLKNHHMEVGKLQLGSFFYVFISSRSHLGCALHIQKFVQNAGILCNNLKEKL